MSKEVNWQTESGINDQQISCDYLTYVPPAKYTWDINFTSTANAQSIAAAQSMNNLATTDNLFSVPLYIVVIVFLIFTVTMSLIYMYHWTKYSLNDPFIMKFSIFYFVGLCLLLVPLIFNLLT